MLLLGLLFLVLVLFYLFNYAFGLDNVAIENNKNS